MEFFSVLCVSVLCSVPLPLKPPCTVLVRPDDDKCYGEYYAKSNFYIIECCHDIDNPDQLNRTGL
jgi:hypothetical protein